MIEELKTVKAFRRRYGSLGGIQRDVAIAGWLLFTSIYLNWLAELKFIDFWGYVHFTAMLFGAGVAYDMFVKLRTLPIREVRLLPKLVHYYIALAILWKFATWWAEAFVLEENNPHPIVLALFYCWVFSTYYVSIRLIEVINRFVERTTCRQ